MDEAQTFGAILRRNRLGAGLTQEGLAERAGLSPRGVIHLERGTRRPYPDTVQRLASALDLAPDERAALADAAYRPAASAPTPPPPGPRQQLSLFGRERELAVLRERLAAALTGHGSLVLVGGEAGIGKTALAASILREAEPQGALTLVGRCFDRAETPPYGPWRDLFTGAPRAATLPALPAAVRAMPAVGEVVAAQGTIVADVGGYLRALAARGPLVALLDDLHWADPASLDLLRVLARALAAIPVLLVATYRSDEVPRHHPLAALLPLLAREADAERLELCPLDDDAVRTLVSSRYGLTDAETTRLVAYLQTRTEGNALFVGELLRALTEGGVLRQVAGAWALGELTGVAVPPLLRQVIDGRVDRLGGEGRRLFAVAAILGHEVPLDAWAAVAETAEDTLLDVVERAVAAHLLEESPEGARVRFAHALVREALYEGTLAARRRRLHRRAGEVLAAMRDPDPDAVADQFVRAGDERAVAWLVAAGDRADRLAAYVTAADRHARALALLGEDGDPALRGWLRVRLGILLRHGDLGRGLAHLEAAAPDVRVSGDPALAAYWQAARGMVRCLAGQGRAGLPDLRAGVAAIRALPEAARAAGALPACLQVALETDGESTYADWLAMLGNLEEGRAHGEALLAARAAEAGAGRARPAGDVNFGLALAYAALGDPGSAAEAAMRARDAYRQLGNHGMAIMASRLLVRFILIPYRADRGVAQRAAHEELARDLAQLADGGAAPPEVADLMARLLDSDSAAVEGRWTATRQAAMTVLERGLTSLFLRQVGASHAAIARGQGDPDVAWRLVRLALPDGEGYQPGDQALHIALPLQQLAPALALDASDLTAARAWLEAYDRWLAWSGAVLGRSEGRALWAAYHRQAGDPGQARAHAEAALALASDPRQPLALVAARRLLGELDTAEGRHAAARHHLDAALALADACAAPYERALTLLALGELRDTTRDREGARAALDEARALLEPLGAKPALARADALGAGRASTVGTSRRAAHPRGLSDRELEVLRLAARGRTSAQIAAQLFLSRRTVEQHLRAVYTKLGVDNRAAAAAFAVEHGLA